MIVAVVTTIQAITNQPENKIGTPTEKKLGEKGGSVFKNARLRQIFRKMVAYTYLHDVDSYLRGVPEDIYKETL